MAHALDISTPAYEQFVVMCSSCEWHGFVSLGLCVGIDLLVAVRLAQQGKVGLGTAERTSDVVDERPA